MQRYLYILCFLLSSLGIQAQIFPIQINTSIRGPYSLNLSDYAQPTYDRISTNIFCADLTKVDYPVKLRLVIRGPGGINISTLPGYEVGPILLDGGTTVPLTGAELSSMFNPDKLNFSGITKNQYLANRALPEGIYQFHFEALDFNVNAVVSNVNIGFASAWLILNDPPIINKPVNEATVQPLNPQNIFFQWTPRHTGSPNAATSVEYDIQLVEVYPFDRNANDAMLSAPPIFETTTSATAYNFGMQDPTLVEGKWYAFRIRARDVNGLDLFKNQGYSEVYKFYYGQPCLAVSGLKTESLSPTSILVSWNEDPSYTEAFVEYRKANTLTWMSQRVLGNSAIMENLDPAATYTFRVKSKCSDILSEYVELVYPNVASATGNANNANGSICAVPNPVNVNATAINSNGGVNVTWNGGTAFNKYILRYRLLNSNDFFMEVETTTPQATLTSIDVNQRYEYQVFYTCTNGTFLSSDFNTFTVLVPVVLNNQTPTGDCFPPMQYSHTEKSTSAMEVYWEKDKETDSYIFYWKTKSSAFWDSVAVNGRSYLLTSLDPSVEYMYKIIPVCKNSGLKGIASNIGRFTIGNVVTTSNACPTPLLNPSRTVSQEEVVVEAEPNIAYSNYFIQIRLADSNDQWMEMNVSTAKKLIGGLTPNTLYEYKIAGLCGSNQSDFSRVDTVRTAPYDLPYACGQTGRGIIISSTTPITSLTDEDPFSAADFNLKVKRLISDNPYNGEATAQVPYLKHSTFDFVMQDVWINEEGQMYRGKVVMKGMTIALLDPALAAKINSFVGKLDEGLSRANMILTMADSIQTALNDVINTANQPIDWAKYEGWTAEQLFAEGKRLVGLAQTLMANGTPQSISEAKKMLMEGIQLIKAAAALGKAGVDLVSDKVNGWLKKLLDKIEDSTTVKQREYLAIQNNLDPQLTESLVSTQEPEPTSPMDLTTDDFIQVKDTSKTVENNEVLTTISSDDRLTDAYSNASSYTQNNVRLTQADKILYYINYYSSQEKASTLVTKMQQDMRSTLNGKTFDDLTDLELQQLLGRIEQYIVDYLKTQPNR